jgi:hypothetical protein
MTAMPLASLALSRLPMSTVRRPTRQLLDQGGLGVDVLARDRVLLQQGLVALEQHARAFQLGFVALALAGGLQQGHLRGPRVDGGQHLARLHLLAFGEINFLEHPADLGPHGGDGGRGYGAEGIQRHRDVGALGLANADRGGRHATSAARAAAPPAATAAALPARARSGPGARACLRALVGQTPCQHPEPDHREDGDDGPDDARTARALRGRVGLVLVLVGSDGRVHACPWRPSVQKHNEISRTLAWTGLSLCFISYRSQQHDRR